MSVDPNIQLLIEKLEQTLSPEYNIRSQAETFLLNAEANPGFATSVLKVITTNGVSQFAQLQAAVLFKNLTLRRWSPADDGTVGLSNDDKMVIKTHLIDLMFTCTSTKVLSQMSDALSVISDSDFPDQWPTLLPHLLQKLQEAVPQQQWSSINCVLDVLLSLTDKYRYEMGSSDMLKEYKYVLDAFQEPLLELFKFSCTQLQTNNGDANAVQPVLKSLEMEVRVFYSLNVQTLPEYFEDHMNEWFGAFDVLLNMSLPVLQASTNDKPTLLEDIKSSICRCLQLYSSKYEEEFRPFNEGFVQTVWGMLTTLSDELRYDQLVATAISFLTAVVKKPWNKTMFSNEQALTSMCEKVIIPQLKLRPSDIEMFEYDGLEYVRRDIEGSDVDTRRRTAVDFIRGLCVHFETQISLLLKQYVASLVQQYQQDGHMWIAKDAAMYIIIALSAQSSTSRSGVTKVNQYVDVLEFFSAHVITELQKQPQDSKPILIADALKFIALFRSQLPPDSYGVILPLLVNQLGNEVFVVHTYAAHAIEKLLTVRDPNTRAYRITPEMLSSSISTLLTSLFNTLNFDDSNENEYVMRAILRVSSTAKTHIAPVAVAVIQQISTILARVSQNPRNPRFNHYLFETVACLVGTLCKDDANMVQNFETSLFETFQQMLSMETAAEFGPYVFQIMSQLLEFHKDVTPAYQQLFPNILHPAMWENHGNAPALVRMLYAYMERDPGFVATQITGVLGVFQNLLSIRKLDHLGLDLLACVFERLPPSVFKENISAIFSALFQRLQRSKTQKYIKNLIVFFSRIVVKCGGDFLLQATDSVQQNILAMILDRVWLPNLQSIRGDDRKLVAIAMTMLVCQSARMLQDPYASLWGPCLKGIIQLYETSGNDEGGDDDIDLLELAQNGMTTAFCQLAFAPAPEHNPVANIQGGATHLAQALNSLQQQLPNKSLAPMLNQLPQDIQATVRQYVQQVGLSI